MRLVYLTLVFHFLSAIAFGNDSSVSSSEYVFIRPDSNGTESYVTVRGEDEKWIVEAFSRAQDGWQEPRWRKAFSTTPRLRSFLRAHKLRLRDPELFEQGPELRSTEGSSPLWKVTNSWSWTWEERYAEWVQQNADPQFFQRYQIATDCADVAFVLRWIFARDHGLPVGSRLAGSGDLFTQDSVRKEWLRLPTATNWWEDKRFMAALNYLLDNTYTHTLTRDSYPIEISQKALLAGSYFVRLFDKTGHTQFVHRTYYTDSQLLPLRLIASTVPRTVRTLFETEFWDTERPRESEGGFMRFRWPVRTTSGTVLLANTKMPYHSTMQFSSEFGKDQPFFAIAVLSALQPGFSLPEWLHSGIRDIKSQLQIRKDIVEQGSVVCQTKKCAPGSSEYENWSTPSRDKRIGQLLTQLHTVSTKVPEASAVLSPLWNKALAEPALDLNGQTHSLRSILFIWSDTMYSSDPSDSVARRWGLDSDGFAANLVFRMSSLLKTRQAKIKSQGVECKSSFCDPEGSQWLKWQTFSEDRQLTRLRYLDQQYCQVFPIFCEKYKSLRDQSVVRFNDSDEPLTSWLNRVFWLNSDPNQDQQVRWGDMKSRFYYRLFSSEEHVSIAETGWALITNANKQNQIEHLIDGAALNAPPDFEWRGLQEAGQWALAEDNRGQESLLHHLSTHQSWRFPFISDGVKTRLLRTMTLISSSISHTLHLIDISGASAQWVASLNDVKEVSPTAIEGVLLIKSTTGQTSLHDFRNGHRHFDLGREAKMTALGGIQVRFENSRFWLVEISQFDGPDLSFSLDKVDGSWRTHSELTGLIILVDFSYAFRQTINTSTGEVSAELLALDANLNMIHKQKLGSLLEYKRPYLCAYENPESNSVCFVVEGTTFNKRPVFTDRRLVSWDKEFIVWRDPATSLETVAKATQTQKSLSSATYVRSSGTPEAGWFTLYHQSSYAYKTLRDFKYPEEGSVLTLSPSDEISRGSGGMTGFTKLGVKERLPSGESLWILRK